MSFFGRTRYIGPCARCGRSLYEHTTTGESSLYSPNQKFDLCEPCFFEEDALIDERGTNNLPEEIARYRETLREER